MKNSDCVAQLNILYVGIGKLSESEENVGIYISERIETNCVVNKITVKENMENYITKIKDLSPNILILIDCVDFGKRPGYYNLLPLENLDSNKLQMRNITLKNIHVYFNMPVWVLGIQPSPSGIGEGYSKEIKKTADHLIDLINMWTKLNYTPLIPGKIYAE